MLTINLFKTIQYLSILVICAYTITILLGLYSDKEQSTTSDMTTSSTCLSTCLTTLSNMSTSATSLCSGQARTKEDKQKVVSFSFYGNLDTVYYRGIKDNLEGLKVDRMRTSAAGRI